MCHPSQTPILQVSCTIACPRPPQRGGDGEGSKCVTEDYRTGTLAPQDSRHSAPPAPSAWPQNLAHRQPSEERHGGTAKAQDVNKARSRAHRRPQREWRPTPSAGFTPTESGRSGITASTHGGSGSWSRLTATRRNARRQLNRTTDKRKRHRPSSETSTRRQCHCTVSQPNRQVAVFHGRTKYCLLRSSPCRPDDNNRLESSSKGYSCPAVAQ